MAKILEGKKLSLKIAEKLRKKVSSLSIKPKLVIIQIGDLGESNTYIRNKIILAEKIGVTATLNKYPNDTREERIVREIKKFNRNPSIHGIMVQLPAPKGFDIEKVLETIDPKKDVDGLTAINTKRIFDGGKEKSFIPATARGILTLLDIYKISIKGKKIVIVGASPIVGRPTLLALLNRGATVIICHRHTKNLAMETKRADILITAVGKPKLITKRHVSSNQVVIDIGITLLKNGKIAGDVDFKNVKGVVKAITPVPGGVGPMTVVSLMENLLDSQALKSKA